MKRRSVVLVVWVAATLFLVPGAFLAGRATLAPPAGEPESKPTATYVAQEDRLGRTATFQVSAQWSTSPLAYAATAGTVTSIEIDDGASLEPGQQVYAIDLTPTVVMPGTIPAFRTLERGVRGDDVAQLQKYLSDDGFSTGSVDGVFGVRTAQALAAWQRSRGLEPTGSLSLGSVIFVPELPVRVTLSENLHAGAQISAGEVLLAAIATTPDLTITVDGNSTEPSAGTPVSVHIENDSWEGIVGPEVTGSGDQPETRLTLEGHDGDAICEPECHLVPLEPGDSDLVATVEIVPERQGVVIPVAALEQAPTGDYYVRTTSGDQIAVTVSITDGSRVMVGGLEAGIEILIAGPDGANPPVDDDPVDHRTTASDAHDE